MIIYLGAIVVASLLGSAHCVGMCGPMVLIATGIKDSRSSKSERLLRSVGYHCGRLCTYLTLGLVAGLLGWALNGVTESWGWIGMATWFTGWMMICLGLWQLWSTRTANGISTNHGSLTRWWLLQLQQVRRSSEGLSGPIKAMMWGLLTTWLPCGWLYTFALVAAGAGSIGGSIGIMLAFWIGTLPALMSVSLLWSQMRPQVQAWTPIISAMLLIIFGGHVVWARSQNSMGQWLRDQQRHFVSSPKDSNSLLVSPVFSVEKLNKAVEELPPCCRQ
jgi:uncharacterized protein